ncbi:hypothetical protein GJAV_G00196880 [Gymnothorax javanicus]|nr:hypothetical protein GJAV_G00196880 [Gymnothorax javanicus]
MRNQIIFMLGCFLTFLLISYHLMFQHISRQILESTMLMARRQKCENLRATYVSAKSIKVNDEFSRDMLELMSCPWYMNVTQKQRYRVELLTRCNASGAIILTQENTILGEKIYYDGERRTKVVDFPLLKMLPKTIPWMTRGQLGRCAVVGNGGILKNSGCGSQIDGADFVIRLNLAPLSFRNDTGVKTSLVTANPSQIQHKYSGKKRRARLAQRVSPYGNAPVIMPAFAYKLCTSISFHVYHTLRALRPEQKVVFFNPKYLRQLHGYWRQRGLKERRLSTGLMLASVALELCEEVNLYGFWPFSVDLHQRRLTHHYYDNSRPGQAHSMPREFQQLLQLHSQQAINLHIGNCR